MLIIYELINSWDMVIMKQQLWHFLQIQSIRNTHIFHIRWLWDAVILKLITPVTNRNVIHHGSVKERNDVILTSWPWFAVNWVSVSEWKMLISTREGTYKLLHEDVWTV